MFSRLIKALKNALSEVSGVRAVTQQNKALTSRIYYENKLANESRYQDETCLSRYGFKAFSQNEEDGIIEEIFNRIGTGNKYFVEFGAGDGTENNTIYPLARGWRGVWLESDAANAANLEKKFSQLVEASTLKIKRTFITAENICRLFEDAEAPEEFDLLSIDIDGNDYWAWKALKAWRPRVVVIEYNATFGASAEWIMKYDPDFRGRGTSYFGASLKSMQLLGEKKGYRLVGCNFSGVNAFFVREDLVAGKFLEPFSSENHFEPPRYPYFEFSGGHPRDFGPFVTDA